MIPTVIRFGVMNSEVDIASRLLGNMTLSGLRLYLRSDIVQTSITTGNYRQQGYLQPTEI